MQIGRILDKLDEYLHKNDYEGAEQHLLFWLKEAEQPRILLVIRNELMGLYRKLGRQEESMENAKEAIALIEREGFADQVGGATTLLNAATVYKAFGQAAEAIPLFERARAVYERDLPPEDPQLAGLYNNMGLALVDLKRFEEADALYRKAIALMERREGGKPDAAITYLNMASAAEAQWGLWDADEQIRALLKKAETLLNEHTDRGGYYAFVCEKCASVYGYYGQFAFKNELLERARRIYEGN